MNYTEMLEIIQRREQLVSLFNKNKDTLSVSESKNYINSIMQLDSLIRKLRQLNYKLLFTKITPFDVKQYYEKELRDFTYDEKIINTIKKVVEYIDGMTCYTAENIPLYNRSEKYSVNLTINSKKIFEEIYPFAIEKTDKIFDNKKIFIYKKSLLYKLSQYDNCIGQTFYDFINKIPNIIIEKTNTIQDIHTLIHEAMHAYHLDTTDTINNYEFAEVIAYSTQFFVDDYLLEKRKNFDELNLHNELAKDLIVYKIKNHSKYLSNNEKHNLIVYQMILETILPYTVYINDKQNNNKDITQKLINISGDTNMMNFDYSKINIECSDIIDSVKMLKK